MTPIPHRQAEGLDLPPHCLILTRYFYTASERPDAVVRAQVLAADRILTRTIVRPLLSYQREALLCLVSDMVAGLASSPLGAPFEKSFLVTALNKGMVQIAAAEFHVFCYAGGKVQTRLWQKRKAESQLFARGDLWFDD